METVRMETAMETHFMAKMGKVRHKDKTPMRKRGRMPSVPTRYIDRGFRIWFLKNVV